VCCFVASFDDGPQSVNAFCLGIVYMVVFLKKNYSVYCYTNEGSNLIFSNTYFVMGKI